MDWKHKWKKSISASERERQGEREKLDTGIMEEHDSYSFNGSRDLIVFSIMFHIIANFLFDISLEEHKINLLAQLKRNAELT